jgi:small subunit ribosomal protein S20
MANHKSAIKRARQTEKRSARNTARQSSLRTTLKKFQAAVEAGNQEEVDKLLVVTISEYDRASQKGTCHPNKAARAKSTLARAARKKVPAESAS